MLVFCWSLSATASSETQTNLNLEDLNKTNQSFNNQDQTNVKPRNSATRAGRMLDLDFMAGDIGKAEKMAKEKEVSGERQSRMLADNPAGITEGRSRKSSGAKKIEIKGFIPIMSVSGASDKEGKQFDSLEDATSDDSSSDIDTKNEQMSDSIYGQQQALKSQLMSNYGGQTSIGHASFVSPTEQQQHQQPSIFDQQQQQQWLQLQQSLPNHSDLKERERSRKLAIGTSNLLAGPKRFVSSLVSSHVPQPLGSIQQQTLQAPLQQMPMDGDCICVPFYQCKNGHLSEWQLSKNQLNQLQAPPMYPSSTHMQQTPRALNHLNGIQANDLQDQYQYQQQQQQYQTQPSASQHSAMILTDQQHQQTKQQQPQQLEPQDQQAVMNQIYEQLKKNIESGQLSPDMLQKQQEDQLIASGFGQLDERNANSSKANSDENVLERGILSGLQSIHGNSRMGFNQQSNQRSCGIMRTCCKLPASMQMARPNFNQRQPQNARLTPLNHQPSRLSSTSFQPNPYLQNQHQHQQQSQLIQLMGHNQHQLLQQPATHPLSLASNSQEFVNPSPAIDYMTSQQQRPHQQSELFQPKPQLNAIVSNPANFMSGRCGVRETLGIAGRVQNTNPTPGSETLADFGEFPAHAAILKRISPGDSLFVCSAVLISNQWLITAAHCVRRLRPEEIKVRLGEWDVSKDDEFYPFVESNVRELIVHPAFQASSLANDIALIRMELNLDAQTTPHIAPACLAYQDADSFAGQRCWIAGWGKDAFGANGQYQSQLKKVDLPVVARSDCEMALRHQTKLGKLFRLHPSDLCAGGERGKDACEGDGGAGLYCIEPESGLTRVLGLVSWGVGCGQRGVPGIYTSIPTLHSWIEAQVAQSGEESVYMDRNIISERTNENGSKNYTQNSTSQLATDLTARIQLPNNISNQNLTKSAS